MNMNLTQPEEIDQILKNMEWNDLKLPMPSGDKSPLKGASRQEWRDGYTSPFRANYMRLHGFSDQ